MSDGYNARVWAEQEAEEALAREIKAIRRRLRHEHGEEGLGLIDKLTLRTLMAHPGMTDQAALAWAEDAYVRGDVLC
jgi:hypothetical protein